MLMDGEWGCHQAQRIVDSFCACLLISAYLINAVGQNLVLDSLLSQQVLGEVVYIDLPLCYKKKKIFLGNQCVPSWNLNSVKETQQFVLNQSGLSQPILSYYFLSSQRQIHSSRLCLDTHGCHKIHPLFPLFLDFTRRIISVRDKYKNALGV